MSRAAEPRVVPLPGVPRTPDGRVDVDALVDAATTPDLPVPPLLASHPGSPGALGWSAVVVGTAGRLRVPGEDPDPVARLDAAAERLGLDPTAPVPSGAPPMDGGLVGAVSYDLARHLERLDGDAVADRSGTLLDLHVADLVVVVDHRDESAVLVHRPSPLPRGADAVRRVASRLVADAVAASVRRTRPPHGGPRPHVTGLDAAAYRAAVAAVLERIAAGDTFQVNLSRRLTGSWEHGAHDLHRRLRAVGPSPHAAVLPVDDGALVAASPESFVLVEAGRALIRPIKGTRARTRDPVADAALADELRTSSKDRAENVMVVDMERNDLGRVCVPGSVRVPRLLELESHPTVHHLVSDVVGRLSPGTTWGGLLAAVFPCGSVTGAPKVSSMRIIDRVEPVRRGWYCGAFGWLGEGRGSTGVTIRSAVLGRDGRVDLAVGGGVVADSDPHAEHLESLAKAAAYLAAVDGSTDGSVDRPVPVASP